MKKLTLAFRSSLPVLSLFIVLFSFAQNASIPVSGVVKDDKGQALSGVSVSVKGASGGVSTDASGKFAINVPSTTSILIFSYIGFQPQEVPVGLNTSFSLSLLPADNRMNDVVVIGYGTQKKISMTSAVSSLKGDEVANRPVNSLNQALQGQLSGLTILDQGGAPGNSNTVMRVRGITTLSSNLPLVIVDGIEQPLSDLNAADVETISVLKDASSTAIYGSRAANGVILVTTKRARNGKLSVSYNGFYGIQKAISHPEHMGLEDYMRLQNVAYTNVGSPAKYTEQQIQDYVNTTDRYKNPLPFDWYNAMYKNAPQTNHTLALSGGGENLKARFSLRYQNQDGIIANTNAQTVEARLNTDMKISNRIKASADINYRYKNAYTPYDITNIFLRMMQNSIWTTPKFPDGTYGIGPQGNNPLLYAEAGGISRNVVDYLTGNAKGEWEIIKGLKFTSQIAARMSLTTGKDYVNAYEVRDYYTPTLVKKSQPINKLTETRNILRELTLNNLLNYTTSFGQHNINALAGYSQIENNFSQLSAYRQNFYNNDITSIGQGTNDATKDNGGGESTWGLRSYFGRVNYSFADKYLFEANGRYDGSSRFLDDNRYSFFPSFSAGWRISREKFWNDNLRSILNEFKLRGSWGKTGNQAVDLYSYFATLNLLTYSFNGAPVQAYTQTKMSNEDLTWETTTQTNFGVDGALLNNRISFSVDYYFKKTDGILLVLPVPGTLGLQPAAQNAGRVDNKGWEFTVGTRNQFGKLLFNSNLNFNINNNKVVNLAGTGPYITGSDIDPRYIIAEGYPINSFWGYKTDGLFQTKEEAQSYPQFMRPAQPGDVKVLDLTGDGKIDAADMTYLGNTFPKYTYGGSFDFGYKNFGLDILFQGAAKVGMRVARALGEQGNFEGFTPDIYTNNYWTPTHTDARFPRPTKQDLRNQASTDRMVINSSYLRVKNLQLSYSLPSSLIRKAYMERMSVFVSATNILTISKMNEWHLDPESTSGFQDYYPQVSIYAVGINLQF
jgi:TonB-linked SusC/RagA family outer membrane protein